MAVQQYVIRYFNPKVHSKPVVGKDGRSHGGHDGWTAFYVYGQKLAKKKAQEMIAIVGENNVNWEPFNDPVKNPYKRRPERKFKKEFRRDSGDGSYDPFAT